MQTQHPHDPNRPLQLGAHWKIELPGQPYQIYSAGLSIMLIRLVVIALFVAIGWGVLS